jgi:hypothetical protein
MWLMCPETAKSFLIQRYKNFTLLSFQSTEQTHVSPNLVQLPTILEEQQSEIYRCRKMLTLSFPLAAEYDLNGEYVLYLNIL